MDFKQKLNKLPPAIQDALLSDYGHELEVKIYDKYGLDNRPFTIMGDIVTKLYFEELALRDLPSFLEKEFNIDKKTSKNIALDIIGMRVLIIRKYLKNENAGQLIEDLGGDVQKYKKYIIKTNEDIKRTKMGDEAWFRELEKNEPPKQKLQIPIQEFDAETESKKILEIFKGEDFKNFLEEDPELVKETNYTIIEVMLDKDELKKNLEKALLENETKLTKKELASGKAPSIKNWLKDFISHHGTEDFNIMVLSDYINRGENVKNLDPKEKNLIRKLILTYRNLKDFPENILNSPEDKWRIIAYDTLNENLAKARTVGAPKNEIDSSLESPIPTTATEKEKELEKLKNLIKKYKEGSLERKAVEEEIKKKEK